METMKSIEQRIEVANQNAKFLSDFWPFLSQVAGGIEFEAALDDIFEVVLCLSHDIQTVIPPVMGIAFDCHQVTVWWSEKAGRLSLMFEGDGAFTIIFTSEKNSVMDVIHQGIPIGNTPEILHELFELIED